MKAKGVKEKHEEQVTFATYAQFYTDTEKTKKQDIAKALEAIDRLDADIAKAAEDTIVNQKAIAAHDADLAKWSAERAAAQKKRAAEQADFEAEHKDYTDAMDTVERTLTTIKSGSDVSLVQQR